MRAWIGINPITLGIRFRRVSRWACAVGKWLTTHVGIPWATVRHCNSATLIPCKPATLKTVSCDSAAVHSTAPLLPDNRFPMVKGSLGFRVLGQSGALGLRALCFRPYEGWCRLVSGIRLCEAKTQLPSRPRGQDRWPCTDELLRLCQSKFLRSTTAVTSN